MTDTNFANSNALVQQFDLLGLWSQPLSLKTAEMTLLYEHHASNSLEGYNYYDATQLCRQYQKKFENNFSVVLCDYTHAAGDRVGNGGEPVSLALPIGIDPAGFGVTIVGFRLQSANR